MAAARCPLRREPPNNQFKRPSAQCRIWFSTQLLSIGTHLSFKLIEQADML
jgi:hypothetical protein